MVNKINKSQIGFTIIELIVVIAIISVLAAIVLPNVSGYLQKAKTAAAVSEIRELQKAIEFVRGSSTPFGPTHCSRYRQLPYHEC